MEKFQQFTDQRAGVNPFVQQPHKVSVIKLLVVLFKAPIALGLLALLAVVSGVTSILPSPLSRPIRLLVERPTSRLLLLTLGFLSIDSVALNKAQARLPPSPSAPPATVAGGDLLLANRCSWVDVLLLSAAYAPQFTRTSLAGGLEKRSVWQALQDAVQVPLARLPSASASASEDDVSPAAQTHALIAAQQHLLAAPLLIQPEGAPSNNRGILSFGPVAEQVGAAVVAIAKGQPSVKVRIPITHCLGIKYTPPAAAAVNATAPTPCYTAGSVLQHVLWVLGGLSHAASISRLPPAYDPQPADYAAATLGGSSSSSSSTTAGMHASWPAAVRDALVTLVRGSRAVEANAGSYVAFRAAWAAQAQAQQAGGRKEE